MNIEEGTRRLGLFFTWLIVICFGIPCVFGIIKSASSAEYGYEFVLALIFGGIAIFAVGFTMKVIADIVCLWIIKGFVGEEKVAEEENDY